MAARVPALPVDVGPQVGRGVLVAPRASERTERDARLLRAHRPRVAGGGRGEQARVDAVTVDEVAQRRRSLARSSDAVNSTTRWPNDSACSTTQCRKRSITAPLMPSEVGTCAWRSCSTSAAQCLRDGRRPVPGTLDRLLHPFPGALPHQVWRVDHVRHGLARHAEFAGQAHEGGAAHLFTFFRTPLFGSPTWRRHRRVGVGTFNWNDQNASILTTSRVACQGLTPAVGTNGAPHTQLRAPRSASAPTPPPASNRGSPCRSRFCTISRSFSKPRLQCWSQSRRPHRRATGVRAHQQCPGHLLRRRPGGVRTHARGDRARSRPHRDPRTRRRRTPATSTSCARPSSAWILSSCSSGSATSPVRRSPRPTRCARRGPDRSHSNSSSGLTPDATPMTEIKSGHPRVPVQPSAVTADAAAWQWRDASTTARLQVRGRHAERRRSGLPGGLRVECALAWGGVRIAAPRPRRCRRPVRRRHRAPPRHAADRGGDQLTATAAQPGVPRPRLAPSGRTVDPRRGVLRSRVPLVLHPVRARLAHRRPVAVARQPPDGRLDPASAGVPPGHEGRHRHRRAAGQDPARGATGRARPARHAPGFRRAGRGRGDPTGVLRHDRCDDPVDPAARRRPRRRTRRR